MKPFIFLTTGEGPALGVFSRGEIRAMDPARAEKIKKGVLKETSKLSKDDCRLFFFEVGVNDLPDSIKVGDMQQLLILTKEAISRGIDLPEKISLDKVRKLLAEGDETVPETTEEVSSDGRD